MVLKETYLSIRVFQIFKKKKKKKNNKEIISKEVKGRWMG